MTGIEAGREAERAGGMRTRKRQERVKRVFVTGWRAVPLEAEPDLGRPWYVIAVPPPAEGRAACVLAEAGHGVCLPLLVRSRGAGRRPHYLPRLPGYLFATGWRVREGREVKGLRALGRRDEPPLPIPPKVLGAVLAEHRADAEAGDAVAERLRRTIDVGAKLRVRDGPFAGFIATVAAVMGRRVFGEVAVMGGAVAEFDVEQLDAA